MNTSDTFLKLRSKSTEHRNAKKIVYTKVFSHKQRVVEHSLWWYIVSLSNEDDKMQQLVAFKNTEHVMLQSEFVNTLCHMLQYKQHVRHTDAITTKMSSNTPVLFLVETQFTFYVPRDVSVMHAYMYLLILYCLCLSTSRCGPMSIAQQLVVLLHSTKV